MAVELLAMGFVFIAEDMVTDSSTPGLVYLLKGARKQRKEITIS